MPKDTTKEIQKQLFELGKRFGFESKIEERVHDQRDTYTPQYDVVWYLNLEKHGFDFSRLKPMFKGNEKWFERIKKIPFAGFEVEGASTSSKNQLGNFANLYTGSFIYKFVVVNNQEANGEGDTFRRGMKLYRYFSNGFGQNNVFFLDRVHLEESISKIVDKDNTISKSKKVLGSRHTCGGETKSVDTYNKIRPIVTGTGLIEEENHKPYIYDVLFTLHKDIKTKNTEQDFYLHNKFYRDPIIMDECDTKNKVDAYYIPKLDIVLGFNAPKSFKNWLCELGKSLKNASVDFPILQGLKKGIIKELYIPLISIEIESSEKKHQNGGIVNMSRNSFLGILVTEFDSEKYVDFYSRELGIKNVISYCAGDLK